VKQSGLRVRVVGDIIAVTFWVLCCGVTQVHVHVTIEVALVALKSKLEVKMSATKLPSCVTMKT